MTLKQLKDLINQIPEDRMNDIVFVAAGDPVEEDEMQSATKEMGLHDDDIFQQTKIYDSTIRGVWGVELTIPNNIFIMRH